MSKEPQIFSWLDPLKKRDVETLWWLVQKHFVFERDVDAYKSIWVLIRLKNTKTQASTPFFSATVVLQKYGVLDSREVRAIICHKLSLSFSMKNLSNSSKPLTLGWNVWIRHLRSVSSCVFDNLSSLPSMFLNCWAQLLNKAPLPRVFFCFYGNRIMNRHCVTNASHTVPCSLTE